ncbi:MAG: ABC transporter permease [Firmicutes bacterium]|uniref:ABC transporter permease n=1 Tax=Candidatus Onthovivens merdipullorum TaxID=2840889 RepID=A0A9D9DJA1_9BACL|nr:ABC transporter permease [Candidatus Onthovivens merdipullorum]
MKQRLLQLYYLTLRDIKIYFKDKMVFLVSLITPMILLVLFITFLKTTYEDTILNIVGEFSISNKLLNAFSGGWLLSSVLATSCVTVSFCSGIMTLDKISKADIDFKVTPVNKSLITFAYVFSNYIATLIVCFILLIIGLIYLSIIGFYLNFIDILLIIANILLTSLFATLIANIIWSFTKSQGVVSGICTLLSALYGFICGAYMPIDSMGEFFKIFTSFLPGTYSTILFRKGFLNSVLNAMEKDLPNEIVNAIANSFDVNMSFFNQNINILTMFLVSIISIIIASIILILISYFKDKSKT